MTSGESLILGRTECSKMPADKNAPNAKKSTRQ